MRRREGMVGVPQFGATVLAEVIRRQPMSPGKVRLAWQLAAGAQLSRVADAEFGAPATLRIRPKDARWAAEIERSRAVLTDRLRALLSMPGLQVEISNF